MERSVISGTETDTGTSVFNYDSVLNHLKTEGRNIPEVILNQYLINVVANLDRFEKFAERDAKVYGFTDVQEYLMGNLDYLRLVGMKAEILYNYFSRIDNQLEPPGDDDFSVDLNLAEILTEADKLKEVIEKQISAELNEAEYAKRRFAAADNLKKQAAARRTDAASSRKKSESGFAKKAQGLIGQPRARLMEMAAAVIELASPAESVPDLLGVYQKEFKAKAKQLAGAGRSRSQVAAVIVQAMAVPVRGKLGSFPAPDLITVFDNGTQNADDDSYGIKAETIFSKKDRIFLYREQDLLLDMIENAVPLNLEIKSYKQLEGISNLIRPQIETINNLASKRRNIDTNVSLLRPKNSSLEDMEAEYVALRLYQKTQEYDAALAVGVNPDKLLLKEIEVLTGFLHSEGREILGDIDAKYDRRRQRLRNMKRDEWGRIINEVAVANPRNGPILRFNQGGVDAFYDLFKTEVAEAEGELYSRSEDIDDTTRRRNLNARARHEGARRVLLGEEHEQLDYAELLAMREVILNRVEHAGERKNAPPQQIDPNIKFIFDEVANMYGLGLADIYELIRVCNEYVPEPGRLVNFQNVYENRADDRRFINQLRQNARYERRMERYRLPEDQRSAVTDYEVFNRVRNEFDTVRRTTDTSNMLAFRRIEAAYYREEVIQLLAIRDRTEEQENLLEVIIEAMRNRGYIVPLDFPASEEDVLERRAAILNLAVELPLFVNTRPFYPGNEGAFLQQYLDELDKDLNQVNAGEPRVHGARILEREGLITKVVRSRNARDDQRINYPMYLALANEFRNRLLGIEAFEDQYTFNLRRVNARDREADRYDANRADVFDEFINDYGLTLAEARELAAIMRHELRPFGDELVNLKDDNWTRHAGANGVQLVIDMRDMAAIRIAQQPLPAPGAEIRPRGPFGIAFGRSEILQPLPELVQRDMRVWDEFQQITRRFRVADPVRRQLLNNAERSFLESYQQLLARALRDPGEHKEELAGELEEVRNHLRAFGVEVQPPIIRGRGAIAQLDRRNPQAGGLVTKQILDRKINHVETLLLLNLLRDRVRNAERIGHERGYLLEGEMLDRAAIRRELMTEYALTAEEAARIQAYEELRVDPQGLIGDINLTMLFRIESQVAKHTDQEAIRAAGGLDFYVSRNVAQALVDLIAYVNNRPADTQAIGQALEFLRFHREQAQVGANRIAFQLVESQLIRMQDARRNQEEQPDLAFSIAPTVNQVDISGTVQSNDYNRGLAMQLFSQAVRQLQIPPGKLSDRQFEQVMDFLEQQINLRMQNLTEAEKMRYNLLRSQFDGIRLERRRRNS